jgi:hypothetical protein
MTEGHVRSSGARPRYARERANERRCINSAHGDPPGPAAIGVDADADDARRCALVNSPIQKSGTRTLSSAKPPADTLSLSETHLPAICLTYLAPRRGSERSLVGCKRRARAYGARRARHRCRWLVGQRRSRSCLRHQLLRADARRGCGLRRRRQAGPAKSAREEPLDDLGPPINATAIPSFGSISPRNFASALGVTRV